MKLEYTNKLAREEVLIKDDTFKLASEEIITNNILINGENFNSLKCLLYDYNYAGKVNLVYIDPPFATNTDFRISNDRANSISSSLNDEIAYSDTLLGAEYLEFLRHRLIILHELLAENGSIYLHIDYKIGHYVKMIMDEIFGIQNFRNDITRIKCNPKNFGRKNYGNIKDMVLFYTKSNNYTWNEVRMEIPEEDLESRFSKIDKEGRRYTTIPLHAPGETKNGETGGLFKGMRPPKGRHWRSKPSELDKLDSAGLIEWSKNGVPRKIVYSDDAVLKGKKIQDVWEFKDPQYPIYPTEKNSDLLKLIIETSSNTGDIVLDCFAGSGSTLINAHKLLRKWIGIDQSEHSIDVIKKRFESIQNTIFDTEGLYKFITLAPNIKSNVV